MNAPRKLDDEQLDQMAELRERGWSALRIAQHFTRKGTPISQGAISWQCLRIGADAPLKQRKAPIPPRTYVRNGVTVRSYTAEEDAVIRARSLAGVRTAEIARELGRAYHSVLGRLMTLARHDARAEEGE